MTFRRTTRTAQPQGAVRPDLANPITRGLFAASAGTTNSFGFTEPATVKKARGQALVSTFVIYGDGGGSFACPLDKPVTSDEWTLFAVSSQPAGGTYTAVYGIWADANNRLTLMSKAYASGNFGADCRPYRIDYNTAVNVADGEDHALAITVSSARNRIEFYVDGLMVESNTLDGATTITVNTLEVMRKNFTTDYADVGATVGVHAAFSRALDSREIASLSANPWQLFEPIHTPIFVGHPDTVVSDGTKVVSMRKVTRTRQPTQYTPIDRSNPITQGLYGVHLPAIRLRNEYITGAPDSSNPDYQNKVVAGIDGVCYPYTTGNPSGFGFTLPTAPSSNVSVLVVASLSDGVNAGHLFNINQGFYAASIRVQAGKFGGTAISNGGGSVEGSAVQLNVPHVAILTDDLSPARLALHVNGKLDGTPSTGYSRLNSNLVGVGSSYNSEPRAAKYYLGAAWTRKLTDAEIASLSANPWQIFEPVHVPYLQVAGVILETPEFSRPSGDSEVNAWTSTEPTLFAAINEVVANDSNYITSPPLEANTLPAVLDLSAVMPVGSYTLRLRACTTEVPAQVRVVMLTAVGLPAGESAWQAVTEFFTTYTATVALTGPAAKLRIEVRKA